MLQDQTRLKVTRLGNVVQVEFTSRKILDEANITEIGDQLNQIIEREVLPLVVICFASVDHLSSAALGTLITVNHKIKSKNGKLRLSDINPQIYEVFNITRLNKLFKIIPTAKEAVEDIQKA
ncbi:MAG: STAS domain-containing protein [Phycisphaerae bacterium]|jgi:anti-sigma B factor antagonist